MNLDFLRINNPLELVAKFNLSWYSTLTLTALTPVVEAFLPVVTQIVLLLFTQIIVFFVDFARLKWLSEKRKNTIEQIKDEINSKSETDDKTEK